MTHDIAKCRTGIQGLDDITQGGLPCGGATLVCGTVGCGKTLLGMEFLHAGAAIENEPGVLLSFEETAEQLVLNARSVGLNFQDLVERNLISILNFEPDEASNGSGKFDMGRLFLRLADVMQAVNAKRMVIDTLDTLFSGVRDQTLLRSQLRGLFHWLRERGITVVATAEPGTETLTRRGVEEYVADCVIKLDYRVDRQIATRRLRIIKYRGSAHPADEFPFIIDGEGITMMPITSAKLEAQPSRERISSGLFAIDEMFRQKGFAKGSTILVSGTSGTGKTSLGCTFLDSVCRSGERAIYFGFEESAAETAAHMGSIGLDLEQWEKKGLLRLHTARATMHGLETHLISMYRLIDEFKPAAVVVDPMTSLEDVGTVGETKSMLTRLFDFLKMRGITAFFTDLTHEQTISVTTHEEVSPLIDTWILLQDTETETDRCRTLLILKSRGAAHVTRRCEFIFTDRGIELQPLAKEEYFRSESEHAVQGEMALHMRH